MVFRGYDPALSRFMQVDPLTGLIPGINSYNFGFNNPIDFVDLLGLMGEGKEERKRRRAQRKEERRAKKAQRQQRKGERKGEIVDQFGGTRGSSDKGGTTSTQTFVSHDAIWLDPVEIIDGKLEGWINDPRKRDPLYWTSDYWRIFIDKHNRAQEVFGEIALEVGANKISLFGKSSFKRIYIRKKTKQAWRKWHLYT